MSSAECVFYLPGVHQGLEEKLLPLWVSYILEATKKETNRSVIWCGALEGEALGDIPLTFSLESGVLGTGWSDLN